MSDVASFEAAERSAARAARQLSDLARGRIRNSWVRTAGVFIVTGPCCLAAQAWFPLWWALGFAVMLFIERSLHRGLVAACEKGAPPKRVGAALLWTMLQSVYGNSIAVWLWFAPYAHSETAAVFFLIAGLANAVATLHSNTRFMIAGMISTIACMFGLPLAQFALGGFREWLDLSPALAAAIFLVFSASLLRGLRASEAAQWQAERALVREQQAQASAQTVQTETLALVQDALRTPLAALGGAVARETGAVNHAFALMRDVVRAIAPDRFGKVHHPLRTDTCDPRELARAAVCAFEGQAQRRGLELFLDVDEGAPNLVVIDAVRVSIILYNLLANAVAATRHGGVRVRLQSRPAERPGYVLLGFCVADTGAGMSRSQHALLFQGKPDPAQAGHGISMARRAAQGLGARITAKSELGAGSMISLLIEAQAVDAGQEQAQKRPS